MVAGTAPPAAPRANATGPPPPAPTAVSTATPDWATAICTPPSTTTPAWPTPRSCPTRPEKPPLHSSPGPTTGTPHTGSPSSASLATTAAATAHAYGRPPAPAWASPPNTPAPTGHRPTAKSSDSTGPSPTNGPTPTHTTHKLSVTQPLTPGCTSTTITGDTPPWAASHPPAASPTSQSSTSRPVQRAWARFPGPGRPAPAVPGR